PAAWWGLRGGSADWGDSTVEQAVSGTRVPWPRGRGLGGTSVINGMIFIRGHRSGYRAWEAAGAKGWGFEDLLPWFRRTEHAEGRDPAVRGLGGPMIVAPAVERHPATVAFVEAALEAGHGAATDISGGLEEGFGWVDLNIVRGARLSAADAYLRPALDRPNLDVVTGALVHRVRIDGDRCTGVDYTAGGTFARVGCEQEVVLCAGAIGSAQLLLLSGVGPAEHLRQVGIEVVADLPGVGENLHDHLYAPVVYGTPAPVPPGRNNNIEAMGLVRSDPSVDVPDLQIFMYAPAPGDADGYVISAGLVTPHSRGRLRLAGADPGVRPLMDPDYLSDGRDVEALLAGLAMVRRIARSTALGPWRGQEVFPGSGVAGQAARDHLRAQPNSYYHYAGTCRIGTDAMAVVDTELRVRGVRGLSVADASVMPSVPSANTQATVMAIAERAASLIGGRPPEMAG
ncbi:GMC family oxidoreductase, partial [Nonomuraea lactucae]|uniref:GMC family oxidoreductase n=1 Tax=Nonomuraea lactucae TaxID=2249762 RepID=UPI000DE2A7FF